MIWLEERLSDAVKLLVLVELFESPLLSLPAVVVVDALLSPPTVGCAALCTPLCAVLCAGPDENGVCPFAVAPLVNKKVSTDVATKNANCGVRAVRAHNRGVWPGVTLTAPAE